MSEDVQCENCGKVGTRKRHAIAPEDWLYIEAKDENDSGSIFIVWACASDCAEALWEPGPGVLELEPDEPAVELNRNHLVPLARLIDRAGLTLESPCSACNGANVTCAWCGGLGARLIKREEP